MVKTLHSRQNKIYLDKLRQLREARNLRQADLALLLGRTQSAVSHVESGHTRLDIIGLRDWLEALNYGFLRFLKELNAELRRADALPLRSKPLRKRKRAPQLGHLGASRITRAGRALDK
ncbi:transcriptional regulator with XRE-family HTH domain [Pelomonas saccharophila]|uniref:Transcriptional regulator with XRE-family HTH domain n=1 Tax=Roseateles saccharophilus TaxID=304 RepID=A0ABU1YLY0_ROSSA|nr:helix-turn-helix transcriptional regulator [Roseateles saccharophilus]MDR7269867.1 transcriptional regulator with XRE-family HTH domain [Roseateles saccharophilus]